MAVEPKASTPKMNDADMPQSEKSGNAGQMTLQQWLSIREEAALRIDPETAEVDWICTHPYFRPELPEDYQSREYFARSPGSDIWVPFDDLPDATRDALYKAMVGIPTGATGL